MNHHFDRSDNVQIFLTGYTELPLYKLGELMNLEDDLLNRLEKINSIRPISGNLGIAKNGEFFWLYYSGMGETNQRKLPASSQKVAKSLIQQKRLRISNKTIALPIFREQREYETVLLKIVVRCN